MLGTTITTAAGRSPSGVWRSGHGAPPTAAAADLPRCSSASATPTTVVPGTAEKWRTCAAPICPAPYTPIRIIASSMWGVNASTSDGQQHFVFPISHTRPDGDGDRREPWGRELAECPPKNRCCEEGEECLCAPLWRLELLRRWRYSSPAARRRLPRTAGVAAGPLSNRGSVRPPAARANRVRLGRGGLAPGRAAPRAST